MQWGRVGAVGAVLLLGAGAVTVFASKSDRPSAPQRRSIEVASDTTLDDESEPAVYRVTYELFDLSGDGSRVSTDVLTVDRPFRSRLVTSTDGTTIGDQRIDIDRLRISPVDTETVIGRVPGIALSDVRLRSFTDDAIEDGLLERRERREVVGRQCQVYRSGTLLGSGPFVPIAAGEYAESCIDAAGLLLEEVLVLDEVPTFYRVATAVELQPAVDIDVPLITGDAEDVGSIRPVDPQVGPLGEFWEPGARGPLLGFAHVGRYSVIPPQPESFSDPVRRTSVIAGVADVYRDGIDVVVIYQGARLDQSPAFAPVDFAPTIETMTLGVGEVVYSAMGTELRFTTPTGRFVHVIGTVRVEHLAGVADALVETGGEGLVYLDE